MALILRVDVDKPYGRKTLLDKIKSKLTEDYWFLKIDAFGYLKATETFLKFCNKNKIKGVFYFRTCTSPNKKVIKLLNEGGHKIGFHAENTKSFKTFNNEIIKFQKINSNLDISSFTKHGSGNIKIGRNHYAPYEPEKYKIWSSKINIKYFFGNEICKSYDDFNVKDDFYPKMFWINKEYRDVNIYKIHDIVEKSKKIDIPVIIHPSNFIADYSVSNEFIKLVKLSKENLISWIQK